MKRFYFIGLLIALISILSCEKEVKVKIPYEGDKIVLNAFIRQDSLIYAQVSQTRKLNENFTTSIPPGTVVQLYSNGVFVQNLTLQNIYGVNYFTSALKAIRNGNYKLVASATNLTTVDGQDVLPSKPSCSKISFTGTTNKDKVQIKINDPVTEKNYYMIRLHNADTNMTAVGPRYKVDFTYNIPFATDIAGTNTGLDIFGDEESQEIVFSDDQFNGKEITISMSTSSFFGQLYIAPEVYALSRAAYSYLLSVNTQNQNQGNPFAEVTVIFNNINKGYGIVAGTADSLLVLRKQ